MIHIISSNIYYGMYHKKILGEYTKILQKINNSDPIIFCIQEYTKEFGSFFDDYFKDYQKIYSPWRKSSFNFKGPRITRLHYRKAIYYKNCNFSDVVLDHNELLGGILSTSDKKMWLFNVHANWDLSSTFGKRTFDGFVKSKVGKEDTILIGDFNDITKSTIEEFTSIPLNKKTYKLSIANIVSSITQMVTKTPLKPVIIKYTVDKVMTNIPDKISSIEVIDNPGSDHQILYAQI